MKFFKIKGKNRINIHKMENIMVEKN